ncbi:MAG: type VI secretion system lipoprotein TssJ [Thiohalomonadales bacterium]
MYLSNSFYISHNVSKVAAVVLLQVMLSSACTNQPSLVEGTIDNGIRVEIKATEQLNYYNGQAHSLYLSMYELNSPTMFRAMIQNDSDRRTLLEGNWSHESVQAKQILSIQPSESRKLVFDRTSKGRYLAIVAGFYDKNEKGSQTKLYSIDVYKENIYWKKVSPKQLLVRLNLGRIGFAD